ncbi:DUF4183 domain-containing protein [Paenibacillus brevis]|uniref:DUF4183 domain-containing protein n=1 Tax=Paenibacillus brevis TaxID=2841508 RepID=A0ABS6FTI1_9BACL|nr:DUF4183 domain-containing protein [Paenibacillus brevis]MBU5673424.1 DUF4183 domain-containing protein [Paenibacillus brevis]
MPVIKPYFTAVSSAPVATGGTVTTVITPDSARFLAIIDAGMIGATDTTIAAASFVDDADAPVTALPDLGTSDYFNVYINGTIQQASLSTLTTASLVLDTTDLIAGVPVVLEVVSLAGVTSDMTTPPDISAPTITIIT